MVFSHWSFSPFVCVPWWIVFSPEAVAITCHQDNYYYNYLLENVQKKMTNKENNYPTQKKEGICFY